MDPPWKYADQRKERKDGAGPTRGIGACHHYDLMTMKDIADIPVNLLTADRCHLYVWMTMPLLDQALDMVRDWHFAWSTVAYCWVKLNPGMVEWNVARLLKMFGALGLLDFFAKMIAKGPGFYTMSNVELVGLFIKQRKNMTDSTKWVRTRPFKHRDGHKDMQVVAWPRLKPHSRKPDRVADSIADMYIERPALEMFSRRYNPGWDHFGNELISDNGDMLTFGKPSLQEQRSWDFEKLT